MVLICSHLTVAVLICAREPTQARLFACLPLCGAEILFLPFIHATAPAMDNSGVDTSMHDIHDADVQDQGMMDSMDDLFGDANDAMNNVNLSLPAVTLPPPPALIRRVAELQSSGACA